MKQYITDSYSDQLKAAFAPFFRDNIDAAVIDIAHDPIDHYKLVLLPATYMMDKPTAEAIRHYVAHGGTVIMTGYSAKVDETGKWFQTSLPGRLTDVFGLSTDQFYRSKQPLKISFDGKELTGAGGYYEVLEPSTAKALATFENTPRKSPAITLNHFGKGEAIYLATASQAAFIEPLVRSLYAELDIQRGPDTPEGVVARVVDGRALYVNTRDTPVTISFGGTRRDVLTGNSHDGRLELQGFGVALLQ